VVAKHTCGEFLAGVLDLPITSAGRSLGAADVFSILARSIESNGEERVSLI
jgi:hypothetical protein